MLSVLRSCGTNRYMLHTSAQRASFMPFTMATACSRTHAQQRVFAPNEKSPNNKARRGLFCRHADLGLLAQLGHARVRALRFSSSFRIATLLAAEMLWSERAGIALLRCRCASSNFETTSPTTRLSSPASSDHRTSSGSACSGTRRRALSAASDTRRDGRHGLAKEPSC